ncbi:hypothetical protein RhiirA5_506972 [Rhizophagus irregularis]|uniref:Uncharacterized protein n=2 Tax=Rhizophagus irregularis TaxID=588596 RepID=A0A2N0NP80_9GLOM|nr:hypothetical protein RhiirA5_506972 [Rhizophagus irregularis]
MTNKSANKAGNNPKGSPAKRKDKQNNPSKRTRTLSKNSMEEDFITDSAADAGESNTTPPQQNNADNFSYPLPKDTAAPSAPNSVMSGTDTSMHAPKDKETSPLDASPPPPAMIDAVNNLLLETYHSYTGCARISGSGDLKRLVIHFNSTKERDACFSL